jgi:uncharacterized protein YoxC
MTREEYERESLAQDLERVAEELERLLPKVNHLMNDVSITRFTLASVTISDVAKAARKPADATT